MTQLIYGRHPVLEALRADEPLSEIRLAEGVAVRGPVAQILALAEAAHVPVKWLPRAALDRAVRGPGSGAHQGVVAVSTDFTYCDPAEILAVALRRGETPFVLVLDQIQDVHNLGNLIRTAVAVGVHGLLLPEHRAAGISPAVHKASAGTVVHIAVARADLLAALDQFREHGLAIVGLEAEAEETYAAGNLTGPLALVVGGESQGLRRAVARRCDSLVRLPMPGPVESLNAGVAGSIMLYEILRQRMSTPAASA